MMWHLTVFLALFNLMQRVCEVILFFIVYKQLSNCLPKDATNMKKAGVSPHQLNPFGRSVFGKMVGDPYDTKALKEGGYTAKELLSSSYHPEGSCLLALVQ